MFKIGATVVVLGAFFFLMWVLTIHDELSRYKREGKDNFKFLFPRDMSVYSDDILARLVYDYNLADDDVERIAMDGVHEAVFQYRKAHPLEHSSSDEIDFINVFPGP